MLDLGTSFLASVERDPRALAIVDDDVRLTYADWYRRISAVADALVALGLGSGDHLLTVLPNRWQAATIHWACQFIGVILTPVNWRVTAAELDFLVENSDAKAIVYDAIAATNGTGCSTACNGRCLVHHALHVRHHRAAEGRAAPPQRRTRGCARPRRAEHVRQW